MSLVARARVLIADQQYLVADALALALSQDFELVILPDRPTFGADALDAIVGSRPDVAVLDYWLPGMHCPTLLRAIRIWVPNQRIVVLSAVCGPEHIDGCLDAGAAGFLPKGVPVDLVAEAIKRTHAGERPVFKDRLDRLRAELSRRCQDQDLRVERLLSLTPREVTVLKDLSSGRNVEETSRRLMISVGTVRGHVHSILRKTGAHSQLEAIAMARRERLIQDD